MEFTADHSRRFAWALLRMAGAFQVGRLLSRRRLAVLTYHQVLPDSERTRYPSRPATVVFASEFEQHIRYLSRSYRIVSGDEVRGFLAGRAALPPNSALITFDDGYLNNYTEAFPILRRSGAVATFFVTTNFVGSDSYLWFDRLDAVLAAVQKDHLDSWFRLQPLPEGCVHAEGLRNWFKMLSCPRRDDVLGELEELAGAPARSWLAERAAGAMTWDQVRELALNGMTIGSHTARHQILSHAIPDVVREEVVASRREIEDRLGQPCWCLSYPNGEAGDFRPDTKTTLRAVGYDCAFTQIPGFVDGSSDPYALPRMSVPGSGDMAVFLSRLTGVHGWFQRPVPTTIEQRADC